MMFITYSMIGERISGLCCIGMLFFVIDTELHELVLFEYLLESPSLYPCTFDGTGFLNWAFSRGIRGHMFS